MPSSHIFRNPATEWLHWLVKKAVLERRHPGLRFRYLAKAHRCTFGKGNAVGERTLLVDCSLGDYSYVSNDCHISNAAFGKYCSVGPFTRAGMGLHPSDTYVSTHPAFYSRAGQAGIVFADRDHFPEKARIEVGHDVWIGANVLIKDGVKIGHGAIVAAGAVVVSDVPAYAVVGGLPAKVLRMRFGEDQVARLLDLRWWDRDEAWIRRHAAAFRDIEAFLREAAGAGIPASPAADR